jgi:regulation of enolase protein 1 (concanavalin A-like superfamily)
MQLIEYFLQPDLPKGFYWLNEPANYRLGSGLEIHTDPETDFWQKTHYGFQRDNGHCLLTKLKDDFSLETRVEFRPKEKYDQCGLMIRVDQFNWIKLSTEFEDEDCSRLGSVVTNLGFSDWATQDISSNQKEMSYRISKQESDFLLEHSFDGVRWSQIRITHLQRVSELLEVGVYACSPIGRDFWCRFSMLSISENEWFSKSS